MLQQCLPLAVLKQENTSQLDEVTKVATVLTACGIETTMVLRLTRLNASVIVATVLTACGIETYPQQLLFHLL